MIEKIIFTLLIFPSASISLSLEVGGGQHLYTSDLTLTDGGAEDVLITGISTSVTFLLVQTHAQKVTLQVTQVTPAGEQEQVEGRHVGLIVRVPPGQTTAGPVTVTNPSADNTTVFLAVVLHGNNVPVPGGCSQTETVAVAPFFRPATLNKAYTVFSLPRSELGVNRNMSFTCNSARYALNYQTYLLYAAGDLRHNYTLFRQALSSMLTPERMQTNGRLMLPRNPLRPMERTVALYTSRAAVFGAAVSVRGMPAAATAYVPSVRHACHLTARPAELYCPVEVAAVFWTLASLLSLLGLAMLSVAAVSLTVEVLISTLLLVGGLAALLFRRLVLDDVMVSVGVGAALGLVCGLLLARQWTWHRWSRSSVLAPSFLLYGASAIALLFMLPALQVMDMTFDLVFWPAFVLGASLVATITRLPSLNKSSRLMRCFLGGLWVVLGVGLATDSVYPYMFIDLYRRTLYPQFRFALLAYPINVQDYVCAAALLLLFLGSALISCQLRLAALAPYQEWSLLPRWLRLPLLYPPAHHWELVAERAPLLPEAAPRGPLRGPAPEYGSAQHRTPQRSA